MTTALPTPEPDDVQRGLTEIEQYIADQAPIPAAVPGFEVEPAEVVDGETRRVRALRAQVAEAHRLAALQDDEAPLLVDTPKVRKRRMKAAEAARLHELAQDPMMRAWQAARMRRLLVAASLLSLTLALGWSTAGVQAFAADGAAVFSPAWWFAWCVEPFISLALLVVVGSRAYLATRGKPLNNTTLKRIEWLFLGLSLGMNAWPYAPWAQGGFSFSRLVLHLMGPIVAVAIVTALPIILAGFADLDHHRGATGGPTGPTYGHNTPSHPVISSPATRTDVRELAARARLLIASGALPAAPSATALRKELGCSTDNARAVRDALRDPSS